VEWSEIRVPKTLYSRLSEVAKAMGFEDPNTLAIHLLREALAALEEELAAEGISEDERKEIIERLKGLGYL